MIRLVASHPTWALGFQDEVWWSRLANLITSLGRRRYVTNSKNCNAVKQTAIPRPGLLWVACAKARTDRSDAATLRRWSSCQRCHYRLFGCLLSALGGPIVTALVMIWDNAHGIKVKSFDLAPQPQPDRETNGRGRAYFSCLHPSKSPWLNSIEPKWVHGKRNVSEADRVLSADELETRCVPI